jgi:hypothetical protein
MVWNTKVYCNSAKDKWTCFQDHVRTAVLSCSCASNLYSGNSHFAEHEDETAVPFLRLENNLRNSLVEVDHSDRQNYLVITTDPIIQSQIDVLKVELTDLRQKLKKDDSIRRNKKHKDPDIQLRINEIKTLFGIAVEKVHHTTGVITKPYGLYCDLAAAKERLKTTNASAIKLNNAEKERKLQAVYAAARPALNHNMDSGKMLVANYKTDSVQAKKNHVQLKFHRFDGTGRIGFLYDKGLAVKDLFERNSKLWIDPDLMSNHPEEQRHLCHINLPTGQFVIPIVLRPYKLSKQRMAELSGHDAVWAKTNAAGEYFPAGSTIQVITINRDKVDGRSKWTINFTFRCDNITMETDAWTAIDFGWSVRGQSDWSIKVAHYVRSDGTEGKIELPERDVLEHRKVDSLRSIIRLKFNVAQKALVSNIEELGGVGMLHPLILKACSKLDRESGKSTYTLPFWKSDKGMVYLYGVWTKNRFTGDDAAYETLRSWYLGDSDKTAQYRAWKGDDSWSVANKTRSASKPDPSNGHRHLASYAANLRDQLHNRRQDHFRVVALEMARYGKLYLENCDFAALALKDFAEFDEANKTRMNWNLKTGSPGSLRTILRNAHKNHWGGDPIMVDPACSSMACSSCGHLHESLGAAEWFRCPNESCIHYGQEIHRDINAAINVAKWGEAKIPCMDHHWRPVPLRVAA